MSSPNYYAIIPANVRYDKDLTPNAKLLYGEITALCNEKGYCWASNSYFAELYSISNRSISKWINQLIEKGYISSKIFYKEGTKVIERRHLYIGGISIDEKFHTYGRKVLEGNEEIFHTPIDEKFQDNNTFFNNTFNNSSSNKEIFWEIKKVFDNNIHPMTPIEAEKIMAYVEDDKMDYRLIIRAIEIAVGSGNRYLNYIEGILKKWREADIKTVEALEAYVRNQQDKKNRKTEVKKNEPRGNFKTEITSSFGGYKPTITIEDEIANLEGEELNEWMRQQGIF